MDKEHIARRGDRRANCLLALALVGLIAVAYWQVHAFGFVDYDDPDHIIMNAYVQGGLSIEGIKWAFQTESAGFRMPMVWLSFMLDRTGADVAAAHGIHLGPDNAGVFHLTNVLLHAANTLLLFLVLLRLTGHRYRSALVAALFAMHPLHVESVAWATERKDVLSGLFWILTIVCYAAYARRPSAIRYLLVFSVFLLSLLAKTMTVTLPVILLFLDYWPLKRIRSLSDLRTDRRRVLWEKVPLLGLALVATACTFSAQHGIDAFRPAELFPLGTRVANAAASYLMYAWQMIWPQGLVPFYPHPGREVPVLPSMMGALWLLGVSLYAVRVARTKPYVLVGWLWYVVTLVPVIGLFQVGDQARADRYTYLPLIGLFVSIVWLLAEVADEQMGRARSRRVGIVMSCLLVCILTALSHSQVNKWRNTVTLFEHTLRYSPANQVAFGTLGVYMLNKNKLRAAEDYFRKALAIQPRNATFLLGLGAAKERLGKPDEAIDNYEAALRSAPPTIAVDVEMYLSGALIEKRRYAEAVEHCRAGIALNPLRFGTHNNLGRALERLGNDREAEAAFREEIRLDRRSVAARINLGRLMAKRGDTGEAIGYLNEAVRLQPSSFEARIALGQAFQAAGSWREAVVQYRKACMLQVRDSRPANSLAWMLATDVDPAKRDGKEAVLLAEFACRVSKYQDPAVLDTLAAAYAEDGRFGDAVETAARASATANRANRRGLADQIRARMELYRSGKPYRESQQ